MKGFLMEALGYLLGFLYGAICLFIAFLLSRRGVNKRVTRKLVHIFIGFEWVILYIFHGASVHFLAVCIAFLSLLVFAYKKRLLKMISSEGDNAPGTVYYAVSMSIMSFASLFEPRLILPFGVAVFVTSLGDGFAGLVGQLAKCPNPKVYKEKTLIGCLCNFVFSTLSALAFILIFPEMNLSLGLCVLIGLLSVGVELVCGFGLDNIALPLSVCAFTYFATYYYELLGSYLAPIILTPFVIAFALEKRALTRGGLLAALGLDFVISISLGNFGFTMLLAFLLLGVLTDKLKKRETEISEEKGSCRDAVQVLSNGLVPVLCGALYLVFNERMLLVAFLTSLSEALGDTAASSLGSHSATTVDLFRFRKCERGMSGGVSLFGTLAAILFSAVIPLISLAWGMILPTEAVLVTAVAIIGVFVDSLLGSLFQAKYRCSVCNKLTEKCEHCGTEARLVSGARIIRNDTVNALSTLTSALLAIIFCILL